MQIDLTTEEMNMLATMLANANIGLLNKDAIQAATLAQSIVAKFQVSTEVKNEPNI